MFSKHELLRFFLIRLLNNNKDNIKLYITGDGALKNLVLEHASKNANIVYKGFVSRSDQLNIINNCDVMVAPSVYPDACPTSIIEGMSLGKPIISTYAGGIPELVDEGLTGYLTNPGSVSELTEFMKKVMHTDLKPMSQASIVKALWGMSTTSFDCWTLILAEHYIL